MDQRLSLIETNSSINRDTAIIKVIEGISSFLVNISETIEKASNDEGSKGEIAKVVSSIADLQKTEGA
jgi:hypothetical protein